MSLKFDNTTSSQTSHRWQFSLKTLLLAMSGTAVGLSIVIASPNAIAVPAMICLTIALPAVLTVILVCGSRYQRTFCIGALFPMGTALYATGWLLGLSLFEPLGYSLEDWSGWLDFFDEIGGSYRVYVGGAWLLAVVIGSITVAVRCHLERHGGSGDHER